MRRFFSAIQFLTVFRLHPSLSDNGYLAGSVIYFPLVGILVGSLIVIIQAIMSGMGLDRLLISLCMAILLIIITRAIHVDGLADTFDAFLSGKDKDGMLAVMRDPHIGTMGATAMVSSILLKTALFYSISPYIFDRSAIIMCSVSRWSMVFAIYLFPYAREEGKAKIFVVNKDNRFFFGAFAISALSALAIFQWKGLVVFLVATLCAYIFGRISCKLIGGITGDVLGAINETTEIACLVTIVSLQHFW